METKRSALLYTILLHKVAAIVGAGLKGTGFAALILLSACKQTVEEKKHVDLPQAESVAVRSLWQSQQCKKTQASTDLIIDQNTLQTWWKTIHNNVLPTPGLPETFNKLDFQKEKIIVVFMGEKPSAGFSLQLANAEARLVNKVLHVVVNSGVPKNDSMQAQLITSPCLVLATSANFTEVKIHEQTQ